MGIRAAAAALAIIAGLGVAGSAPSWAATDEDQVRAVLDGMNGSYNRTDFDEFASHLCADMLQADGFKSGWYESRKVRRTHPDHRQLGGRDWETMPLQTYDSRRPIARTPRRSTSISCARPPSGRRAAIRSGKLCKSRKVAAC